MRISIFISVAFSVFCFVTVLGYQVGNSSERSLPLAQPLTRSLLSGSDALFPVESESGGGSCDPSMYSRPYVLCSATDAASAAIDFSKGSIHDGVVDSPPSRGFVKTSNCSPSPLKHTASTAVRDRSPSPTQRIESTSYRKLYGGSGDDYVIPCVKGNATSEPLKPISGDGPSAILSGDRKRRPALPHPIPAQFPRIEDNSGSRPPPVTAGTSGSAGPQSQRPNLRGDRRLASSGSTGLVYPNLRSVNRVKAPRPTTSLSNSETPPHQFRHQSQNNSARWTGTPGPLPTRSGYPMPSRREDILRGMAKVKALEAAKMLHTRSNDG